MCVKLIVTSFVNILSPRSAVNGSHQKSESFHGINLLVFAMVAYPARFYEYGVETFFCTNVTVSLCFWTSQCLTRSLGYFDNSLHSYRTYYRRVFLSEVRMNQRSHAIFWTLDSFWYVDIVRMNGKNIFFTLGEYRFALCGELVEKFHASMPRSSDECLRRTIWWVIFWASHYSAELAAFELAEFWRIPFDSYRALVHLAYC